MVERDNCSPSRRTALAGAAAFVAVHGLPSIAAAASTVPNRPVRLIENVWIRTRDGINLACRLWVPADAALSPVGVVLEATPYSKRDGTRAADTAWAERFCPHGFAYARLDLRGSGESQGLLRDEYLAQEQADIVDTIEFLAKQPWCNGSVGMRGYSWGGIAALQVAALNPPSLRAIISACSTDRRYVTDAHYVGGTLGLVNMLWGTMFKNVLVDAPDPAIVGHGWREQWMGRLEASPAIIGEWLTHVTEDEYWKHGSVAEDYSLIKCGVYAVGGQNDAYTDTVLRLLDHLKAPCKALIGPWSHGFPDVANPGPGLDWVSEEVRWWAYWLHGVDTGVMRDPALRAYINDCTPAEVWPKDVPGRWVAEESWPSSAIRHHTWFLNEDGLAVSAGKQTSVALAPHQTIGLAKREWIPLDLALDLPGDQTSDDVRSLSFDTAPLEADLELFGIATLKLRVAADRPVAKVVVRLNEVHPDGVSRCVSYGTLALSHRSSQSNPAPLDPGVYYDVAIPLHYAAHRFQQGNRLRVAISEALWPLLLPSPEPVTLAVVLGVSKIDLPVRLRAPSELAPMMPTQLRERNEGQENTPQHLTVTGPEHNGKVQIVKVLPASYDALPDIATQRLSQSRLEMRVRDDDPTSNVWIVEIGAGSKRPDWDFKTLCSSELTVTKRDLHVVERVLAFEGDRQVFERTAERTIPRRLA